MLAGAVLGAYRVVRKLGAGGMGSVWIAEHTILGRKAALKVLHPDMSAREDIVKRFFNEARAATTVPDPGIVQIFDFGYADDGSAYIVMELLEGEVLERRIQRGRLDIAQALRLMRQVASTLGAAHAHGIIHRDIKPDNIFIIKDPEVAGGERAKILDFGIAKLNHEHKTGAIDLNSDNSLSTTGAIGTPLYMSPEQRAGTHIDARSDVYALGCVLYQMLTGRPPYDPETLPQLIAMHLSAPIPLPSEVVPNVPPVVDDIIECCMAKDAAHRYASGTELAAALAEASVRPSSSPILATTQQPHLATTLQPALPTYDEPLPETLRKRPASQPANPVAGDDEPTRASAPVLAIAAAAAAKNTTLTGGIATVNRPGGRTRPGVLVAAGLLTAAGAGAIVWGVARSSASESTENTAAPAAEPTAVALTPEPATPTDPAPDPVVSESKTDPSSEALATAMIDVVGKFRGWAAGHAGAPCPQVSDLGGTVTDPWGSALSLTCEDQPDDQQIGVISAGPDRVPGTDDDMRSWRIAKVRDAARGTRWEVLEVADTAKEPKETVTAKDNDQETETATAKQTESEKGTESKTQTSGKKKVVAVKKTTKTTTPTKSTTATPTKTKTDTTPTTTSTTKKDIPPETSIKLDANGIPIHR